MPICIYCKNLGLKSANTHWVRETKDLNSKIICPELINTVCNFCKESGHTVNYCSKLKKINNTKIALTKIEYNPEFLLSTTIKI